MSRPMWFVNLLKTLFPARFIAAKIMRRITPLRQLTDALLFRGDDIIYLPKDHIVEVNQAVTSTGEVALPSEIVFHYIQQADDLWVMDKCICRDASQCDDYPINLGCLFMGSAVRHINPKLGRRVTRLEAMTHIERARDAGLVHMIGRNRLDTVWLGVGPLENLLTVCNCCPCCCLWRVLPDMPGEISQNVSRMPGVTVEVTEQCVGCGTCMKEVCFVQAIKMDNGKAVITEDCRGCGRCVEVCPQTAISLTIGKADFIEQSIQRISYLVDVGG